MTHTREEAYTNKLLRDARAISAMRDALERFISTIDSTGGLIAVGPGLHAPKVDPDWIDLGDAYLAAKHALELARAK